MNILLVQPRWKFSNKVSDAEKYLPLPLLKFAALFRKGGHNVHLMLGDSKADIPFTHIDRILVTTVFSYCFGEVRNTVESLRFLYPQAKILIGGVHASISPEIYNAAFPYAEVHVGPVREAEAVVPAYDLVPFKTVFVRFSEGCIRRCSFCYAHRFERYRPFTFEEVSPKIVFPKVICNDNNILAHPGLEDILKKLADFKVNGRELTSVEWQGGWDIRILYKRLALIPLFKECRTKNIRIAWDGGLDHALMVEKILETLYKYNYDLRRIRCYMLYNHDLGFDDICKKLEHFSKWRLGIIHSRFRPISCLSDGYIPQKKSQLPDEYYIHPMWSDKKIRIAGSIASDISRMCRSGVQDVDEVRAYYNRPSVSETLKSVA